MSTRIEKKMKWIELEEQLNDYERRPMYGIGSFTVPLLFGGTSVKNPTSA